MTDKQFINLPKNKENYAAVYILRNSSNGKIYVGQTINFYTRIQNHVSALKNGNHSIKEMQADYNKGHVFRVGCLYKMDFAQSNEVLLAKEWEYIQELGATEFGYNAETKMPDLVADNDGKYLTHQKVIGLEIYDWESAYEKLKDREKQLNRKDRELGKRELKIFTESRRLQERLAKSIETFTQKIER